MGGSFRVPRPPAFDGYRGLIILAIVVLHTALIVDWAPQSGFLNALRQSGYFSVEFLFVVSGFAIFLPTAARGDIGSVRTYALRRVARIVPAYYISLIATVLVVLAIGHPPQPLDGPEVLAVHVVFAQQEFGVSGFGTNPVYWILSIIVLFYALVPLIWRPYLRHPLIGLAIAVATVVVWRVFLHDDLTNLQFRQFPLFVADFAIGMTAAWAFVRVGRGHAGAWLRRNAIAVTLLALIAMVAMLYVAGHQRPEGEPRYEESASLALLIPLTFIVAMCATTFMPAWAQWPLTNRAVRWTGDVSYGVYLNHVLVLQLMTRELGFERDNSLSTVLTLAAIVIPISLVLGWLSFRFVEQPVRRWARSLEPGAGVGARGVEGPAREPAPTSV